MNFRSCKQNIWKKTPFKIDLSRDRQRETLKKLKPRGKAKRESGQPKPQMKVVDFEHPIFASHNTNSYKYAPKTLTQATATGRSTTSTSRRRSRSRTSTR